MKNEVTCDDFACGAKILNFAEYISIFREKGISVIMMLQSESQLKSIYGTEDAKTIINNSDTYIYMGGMDLDTAWEISRRINRPLEEILYMPIGQEIIFRRGEKPIVTQRYNILEDKEYQILMELLKTKEDVFQQDKNCKSATDAGKVLEEETKLYKTKFYKRDIIEHPIYGVGVVKKIELKEKSALLNILFKKSGEIKQLDERWVLGACRY